MLRIQNDTFEAAMCIASRGKTNEKDYPVYVDAIRSLRSHIYAENYTPEIAAKKAAKVIYAVTCLKKDIPYQRPEEIAEYKNKTYIGKEMLPLSYLKKVDLEAYAYTIEADRLISEA